MSGGGGDRERRPGRGSGRARSPRGGRRYWSESWFRLQEREGLWIALFVLIGFWTLAPDDLFFRHQVQVGEITDRDYVADRDLLLVDETTTNARRQRAREEVLPVYDFDQAMVIEIDGQFERLFRKGRELLEAGVGLEGASVAAEPGVPPPPPTSPFLTELRRGTELRITQAQLEVLASGRFSEELEDRVRTVVRSLLSAGVVANKTVLLENRTRGVTLRELPTGHEDVQLDLYGYRDYPEEVDQFLQVEVARWSGWRGSRRETLRRFVLDNVPPNVSLNLQETSRRRTAAELAVEESFTQVKAGQVIARRGDQLTGTAVELIEEMRGARPSAGLIPALGTLLLVFLVALGIQQGNRRVLFLRPADERTLGGMLLLLIGGLISCRLGMVLCQALAESFERAPLNDAASYRYAMPYAALALVMSLFYGRGRALLGTIFFAVLVSRTEPTQAFELVLYVLFTSLAAIYALDRLHQRSAITRAALIVGATAVVSAVMIGSLAVTQARSPSSLLFDAACAIVGGILVAAATSFVVPVLESLLGLTTDIKLLELSDTNLPLLRRVAFEAPGTFQHSLMVANLAKAGCEAIGANAVLAYTAGLYHDIGKVLRPGYFVENQWEGANPHDKLAPSMSALIVVNHVKEGAELAREQGLPQPIVDAILQHHGTRRLTYFYNRALEQCSSGQIDEQAYRYPGPKPQNKVMGVLLCADAIEAASRTIQNPSSTSIRALIDRLVGEAMQEGQLDESNLTLTDIRLASEAFSKVLQRIYHKRVDYPGYDFNTHPGSQPGGPAGKLRMVEGGGAG
ncbi:MAG: HDIG domain-containing protein [Acidobacteria bacterium]|nr:MAG: HDIG domain-containing protein [Acidobacteriota bacterium]REK01071.1 MAG: HDIG domain-containing protein [Acidobacteriota bacterium]